MLSIRSLVGGSKSQPQPQPEPPQRPARAAVPARPVSRPPIAPTEPRPAPPVRETTPDNDNRSATRRPASAVPEITGLRFSPHGAEATLVNISKSGLLAECGERLQPGSKITVQFEGTFSPASVEGRVARNSVSAVANGRLRYHVGIAFTAPIDLGEEPTPEPVAAAAAPSGADASTEAAPVAVAAVAAAEPVEVPVLVPVLRNRW